MEKETLYVACTVLVDLNTRNVILREPNGAESYIPFDPLKYPNGVSADDIYRCLEI